MFKYCTCHIFTRAAVSKMCGSLGTGVSVCGRGAKAVAKLSHSLLLGSKGFLEDLPKPVLTLGVGGGDRDPCGHLCRAPQISHKLKIAIPL